MRLLYTTFFILGLNSVKSVPVKPLKALPVKAAVAQIPSYQQPNEPQNVKYDGEGNWALNSSKPVPSFWKKSQINKNEMINSTI
ncbi:hypothetical protein BB561_001555 [Smittium simulii]|uniref:Uncharacterized protein n=1 Tax=Smittium simulii TaxID=133385 RepID=A0A2T9YU58_9FUNG|nr:hypothetical protein BB561_001555 [Smittium simulii]